MESLSSRSSLRDPWPDGFVYNLAHIECMQYMKDGHISNLPIPSDIRSRDALDKLMAAYHEHKHVLKLLSTYENAPTVYKIQQIDGGPPQIYSKRTIGTYSSLEDARRDLQYLGDEETTRRKHEALLNEDREHMKLFAERWLQEEGILIGKEFAMPSIYIDVCYHQFAGRLAGKLSRIFILGVTEVQGTKFKEVYTPYQVFFRILEENFDHLTIHVYSVTRDNIDTRRIERIKWYPKTNLVERDSNEWLVRIPAGLIFKDPPSLTKPYSSYR